MKFIILTISSILFLSGCHVPTKVALEGSGGRSSYNIAIQKTNNEELLLNLVRLKYYDAPFFLELGNITTQFTYKAAANPIIRIPGFTKDNPFTLGGEFSWQNQPTISYSPLEGKEFTTQLMQPIDLSTIQQLVYSGWDIDRLFRLVIENLDELPNSPMGTGPVFYSKTSMYEKFYEATSLMRYFQLNNQLQIGVSTRKISYKHDENVDTKEQEVLQISFPKDGEESKKLASLLGGVESKNNRHVLSMVQGFNEKGNIGVMSRSLLSCLYYLGQSVQVPAEDIKKGKVAIPVNCKDVEFVNWKKTVHSLMDIQCNYSKPVDAYICVKYRDVWFYISDNDLESKRTFILMQQLFNMQAAEPSKAQPILSLPLG